MSMTIFTRNLTLLVTEVGHINTSHRGHPKNVDAFPNFNSSSESKHFCTNCPICISPYSGSQVEGLIPRCKPTSWPLRQLLIIPLNAYFHRLTYASDYVTLNVTGAGHKKFGWRDVDLTARRNTGIRMLPLDHIH
ncbi:hypothetical protein SCLCIDRAFT_624414 [Scleroderma citrinum Foug A]|uniref:Uncharacterized protein n=1 Tax=Scleroderma citrinum Foug A TaxID=1036808 RepID=A0A0C2YPE1_9AGAM|nr:hypothetical protein SCLCIDRAFT_624414 [Scleroderma citrinum Foug A]